MVANSDKAIPLLEKVGLGIAYKPRNPELKAIAEKTIHILPELLAIIE
jgi:phosphoserine phosphatase